MVANVKQTGGWTVADETLAGASASGRTWFRIEHVAGAPSWRAMWTAPCGSVVTGDVLDAAACRRVGLPVLRG